MDPKQIYTLQLRAPPGHPVSGVLINALTGLPLPSDVIGSVVVTFTNNATGEVTQATINPDGSYTANLPNGQYTMTASAADYVTGTSQVTVNNGSMNADIILSPIVEGKGIRIVLQWNVAPKDLDLYCQNVRTGEIVYYRNKVVGPVNLDVDNTQGKGPETITVKDIATDAYKVVVRNFSKEVPLSSSGAKVDVTIGDRLAQSVTVPSGAGEAWEVLTVDATNGQIVLTNRLS
jgi:hypothetical protein